MAIKRLWQVDAFADRIYRGNPCAVVFDAAGLDTAAMQAIAQEMNLSETVFLLPPTTAEADYRARIFTPRSELPFAGHPTISAAFCVWSNLREAGFGPLPSLLRQECTAGIIPVRIGGTPDAPEFTMTQRPAEFRDIAITVDEVAAALGCAVTDIIGAPLEAASTGIWWMFTRLRTPGIVASLDPDMSAITALSRKTGITGHGVWSVGASAPDCQIKLRCFAPAEGIPEDPVTGSANGCLAALIARGKVMGDGPISYRAEQGAEIGRDGRIAVAIDNAAAGPRIGGHVVRVMVGDLEV
ncbi:MAG: PhzF family phenazine biosynthesis protein [Pseudomonadota bacterium]|nr:PhzF family phenazine biosynthesis protein [Pseudomonadota bacterium]